MLLFDEALKDLELYLLFGIATDHGNLLFITLLEGLFGGALLIEELVFQDVIHIQICAIFII
jgi:hypothetical protein